MVSKTDIRQRFATWLDQALAANGVPDERGRQRVIAKRYKVTPQMAGKWLRGESMPDAAQIGVIAEDLTGPLPGNAPAEVEAARRYLGAIKVSDGSLSSAENASDYVRLPRLAMEGGMGYGTEINDPPAIVEYLDIAKWWAEANLPKPISRIKVITGTGDSNAPLINHEDIVFVDAACNSFLGPDLYVFNWQGRALIKRLAPDIRGNNLQIVSANPAYPPETISINEIDQLHISGRVVAWYTLRHY